MFTLEQIFKKDRTETPYLMGDVFTKGDIEFTIVDMRYDGGLVGFTRKGKDLYISFFQSVDELMAQGYAPVLENIELCKEYAKEEIFALRRLKDGTIAGIRAPQHLWLILGQSPLLNLAIVSSAIVYFPAIPRRCTGCAYWTAQKVARLGMLPIGATLEPIRLWIRM